MQILPTADNDDNDQSVSIISALAIWTMRMPILSQSVYTRMDP